MPFLITFYDVFVNCRMCDNDRTRLLSDDIYEGINPSGTLISLLAGAHEEWGIISL